MTRIEFFVPGIPRPQGSKRSLGRGVMVESSKYVADWRQDVKQAAWTYRLQMEPLTVPLSVRLDFNLPRPKYHYGSDGAVKPRYDLARPSSKPDVDKLTRAVLDAITSSGLWRDDSLVVDLRASKWFSANDVGVQVLIVPALGGNA
jgi:crossover junction endodeoxyribonuclease RusA